MLNKIRYILAVGLAAESLVALAPHASAATASTTIAVSATVLSFCTITALPLTFGNYSSTTLDATTTVAVVCSATTPFNVGLDAGIGSGANVTTRRMTNGTSTLAYTLSQDAARTLNFGQAIGTDTLGGLGTGLLQTVTIYGRIPANQFVGPGLYLDTITATVTY